MIDRDAIAVSKPRTYDVLGTKVAITSPTGICDLVEGWAAAGAARSVCFPDAHAILKGRDDPRMRAALDDADVVCPDGHSVALTGRLLRRVPARRTCGPDTVLNLCARSAATGLSHYFYGGAEGVAETMVARLRERFPGLLVAGLESPPMRPLTPEEDDAAMARILAARPAFLWIGLGAPKQEIWMMEHKEKLPGITMLGVGAAFDFHAGRIKRAPRWMQRVGLEWIFRAASEPRRLGTRYARTVPRFVQLSLVDLLDQIRYREAKANT